MSFGNQNLVLDPIKNINNLNKGELEWWVKLYRARLNEAGKLEKAASPFLPANQILEAAIKKELWDAKFCFETLRERLEYLRAEEASL